MEQELIRPVKKLGNSSSVLLPKSMIGSLVSIKIIHPSKNIIFDLISILDKKGFLGNVQGVYLYGSYARGEQTERSDIDILVITDNISATINENNYSILILPERKLISAATKGDLMTNSIINESKPLLNKLLMNKIKNKKTKVDKKLVYSSISSALDVHRSFLELEPSKYYPGKLCYSLVLNSRELYLFKLLNKKIRISFKSFLKKSCGDLELYEAYQAEKNNQAEKNILKSKAIKLFNYLEKEVRKWEGQRKPKNQLQVSKNKYKFIKESEIAPPILN